MTKQYNLVIHLKLKLAALTMLMLSALLISGCASQSASRQQTAVAESTIEHPKTQAAASPGSKTELDSELLYDLLLGQLAQHRGEFDTALDSLSSAAYASRDSRLAMQATRLALHQKDFQRALELAQFHSSLAPDDDQAVLTLAYAQLAAKQFDQAADRLLKLAASSPQISDAMLYSIAATFTSIQDNDYNPLQVFDRAAARQQDLATIAFVRALIATSMKDRDTFYHSIDRALELKPNWAAPAILKLSAFEAGDVVKMQRFANDFLARNAKEFLFRMRYGQALVDHKLLNQAIKQFKKILSNEPEYHDARLATGIVYFEQNKLRPAKRYFKQFLNSKPGHDQTRFYLAEIAEKQNNYQQALAILREVASDSYYFDAQVKIGRLLAKQSGTDSGIEYLRQVDSRNDDQLARLYLEQDILLRAAKLPDHAKTTLDEGLQRLPGHPDLLYNRGLLLAQMNLVELHEQDMRLLISQQPDNAQAYNALGYTLADQTDRYQEALQLIATALKLKPNDPFILDSMGWVQYRLGNHQDSLIFLRRAVELKHDAEIAAHLGEVLWALGNKNEARQIWKQGRKWDPENKTLQQTIKRLSAIGNDQAGAVIESLNPIAALV